MINLGNGTYQADEGKVFSDGTNTFGETLDLAVGGNIANYIEVDVPVPPIEPPIQTVEERLESIDTLIQDLQGMYFEILMEA